MRIIDKQALKFTEDLSVITEIFDSIKSISVVFDSTNNDGENLQYIASFTWNDDEKDWFLKIDKIN